MQRLCSLHIICCVACLLLLQIFYEKVDSLAAALCDTDKVFPCPTLRSNLSAPFWGELECAASNSFVISNCSGGQPSWEGFDKAAQYDDGDGNHLGAPELIGLYKAGYTTYINLTWTLNETVNGRQCAGPIPFEDVDSFLPDVINLTSFANGSFQFSSNNAIFLFGCDVINLSDSDTLSVESDTCREYKQQCGNDMLCAELKPFQELALHKTLQNLSCSHFKFLTTVQTSKPVSDWSNAVIQLIYGDIKCQACLDSEGQCYFNKVTRSFEQCICGVNSLSDTDCFNIGKGCTAFACNIGAQIGLAVGVTSAAFIVLALCCLLKPKPLDTFPKFVQTRPKPSHPTLSLDLEKLTERPVEISYSSIVSATSNFNNVLGEGGFGVVYCGLLTGVPIAVKVVAEVTSEHRKKHFVNEVATIGRIHHVHVVRLLGFCMEQHHRILVYEYVNNGSLDNWLFKHRDNPEQLLSWTQRYNIAVGIAKGLGYLHEECRHRIVHCDIKPQNILLDENFCPKIADFGLAKLMARDESAVATIARGTPGYIAPEFWMGGEGQISTKFDVYSFGMVLLELISGRRNFENGSCFPKEAFEAAIKGNIQFIIDVIMGVTMPAKDKPAILIAEEWQHLRRALFVALWCIQDHPMSRPHMSEVVLYLEGKIAVDEHPPRPAIASILLSLSCQQWSHQCNDNITPISGC
ncbi:hypothetical protein L7F22_012343 [Adiantum nelumboides]|nr:hypothetical protein [Adiantum nelumboides]